MKANGLSSEGINDILSCVDERN